MAAILETRQLSKHFGAVAAADAISVAVEEQSVVGLIGTNGAGKTTFINMVTGYLKPSAGSIHFRGADITALTPRQVTRRGIGRSFQVPQLYDSLSVADNVRVGLGVLRLHRSAASRPAGPREEEAQVDALVQRFNLGDYRDAAVRALPQGVRKLLDIALAMVTEPQLLLLDEPTSGVSSDEKFAIMDMIMKALNAERVTTLFVEHDMDVISRYAARVLAFYDGRIIADGAPAQVLSDREVRRLVVGGALEEVLGH